MPRPVVPITRPVGGDRQRAARVIDGVDAIGRAADRRGVRIREFQPVGAREREGVAGGCSNAEGVVRRYRQRLAGERLRGLRCAAAGVDAGIAGAVRKGPEDMALMAADEGARRHRGAKHEAAAWPRASRRPVCS